MKLPMPIGIAQNSAQIDADPRKRFAELMGCASVILSAIVPSFVRADALKTACYPSPSRRSVRLAFRPPVFRGQFKVWLCLGGNNSAGEDAKCAQVLKSFSWQQPQQPLRAATHPTLSGRVLARQQAVSQQPFLTAMSQRASLLVQRAAHFVTMWACATKPRADQLTQFNLITDHRGALMPCGGLLRSVWPVMAREEGQT